SGMDRRHGGADPERRMAPRLARDLSLRRAVGAAGGLGARGRAGRGVRLRDPLGIEGRRRGARPLVSPRRLAIALALAMLAAGARFFATPSRLHEDLPPEFAGKRNPLGGAEAIAAGGRLFRENCASCHGELADGHGPAATGLQPPPANFRTGPVLAQHSDAY